MQKYLNYAHRQRGKRNILQFFDGKKLKIGQKGFKDSFHFLLKIDHSFFRKNTLESIRFPFLI